MMEFIRRRQSPLIAAALVLTLGLWMLSGRSGSDAASPEGAPAAERDQLTSVRVSDVEARSIRRQIVFSGRTESAREVTLRAEIDGRVAALEAKKGAILRAGDLIARLELRDRRARLAEARALVKQRELQHAAAEQLLQQNLQSKVALAETLTQLEAARAAVLRIEIEISNTELRAPFDGLLDRLPVEVGTYVRAGDEVATVLEQDPMLVVGNVTQQDIGHLVLGDRGIARLVNGRLAEGFVRYVAAASDPATRTFRVEIEVPNPDGALLAGVTGEVEIPVERIFAHHISPALLSLDKADQIGVKLVNQQDVVEFHPVSIVRAAPDGLWVSGLRGKVRVITVGQGFVRAGERVNPVPESAPQAPAAGAQ